MYSNVSQIRILTGPFVVAGLLLYGANSFRIFPPFCSRCAPQFPTYIHCSGPFVIIAKCVSAAASGSKNLDLMASVKVSPYAFQTFACLDTVDLGDRSPIW